jgi:hypothetical protein
MVKGHLDQSRSNQPSTKHNWPFLPTANTIPSATSHSTFATIHDANSDSTDTHSNIFPVADDTAYFEPTNDKLHLINADFATDTGKIFSDLTDRFIQPSTGGNSDLLEVYD